MLPPGAFAIEVSGAYHELAHGLEKGDQLDRLPDVARLDVACAKANVSLDLLIHSPISTNSQT